MNPEFTRSAVDGPMLEDIVLAALAAGRVRQAGRRPACPVCGEAMWTFERGTDGAELCCSGCGSRLWDAAPADVEELRLIA